MAVSEIIQALGNNGLHWGSARLRKPFKLKRPRIATPGTRRGKDIRELHDLR
jgi:hypothetical protein